MYTMGSAKSDVHGIQTTSPKINITTRPPTLSAQLIQAALSLPSRAKSSTHPVPLQVSVCSNEYPGLLTFEAAGDR